MNADEATSDARLNPEDEAADPGAGSADPRTDDFDPEGLYTRPWSPSPFNIRTLDDVIAERKKRRAIFRIYFEEARKTRLAMLWIVGITVGIVWCLAWIFILLLFNPEIALRLSGR